MHKHYVLAAALLMMPSMWARADVLTMPPAETAAPAEPTPAAGMTMDQVRQKFGEPRKALPAVGKPPITRWEYEGYIVYFEHHYVLRAVPVRAAPQAPVDADVPAAE
ncbi:MAG: hypothetical protein AB1810_01590 [Pseudomonadota bacterium]